MRQPIIRDVVVTAEYVALVPARTAFSGMIQCPPDNADSVAVQGDDGSDTAWLPGECNEFVNVDLSLILVKGTPGDVVAIRGGA